MKFAREFTQSLEKGEFPSEWIESAISYKHLKKCIKKVQKELRDLGLDARTLEDLWEALEDKELTSEDGRTKVDPKFVIALDPETGAPKDAWLAEETRQALERLGLKGRDPASDTIMPDTDVSTPTHPLSDGEDFDPDVEPVATYSGVSLEEVELPLISNSEFFHILQGEISTLDKLQEAEQQKVEAQISELGKELTTMVETGSKKSRTDTFAWREIFRIYVDSQIFFSSKEKDSGTRNSTTASTQLMQFASIVKVDDRLGKLTREGRGAYDRFMRINSSLLQYLKFQELNQTALSKIMKKFDKRTALHAQAIIPSRFANKPFIAQSLARAACFKISEDLLTIIPQLNDYLCPICFSVSFKPIRLKCEHVFCIRCLIVMQKARQNHCPLCREGSVMEASSNELDLELMEFLKTHFPKEVKAKQKENEIAAGVDQYGKSYERADCVVM